MLPLLLASLSFASDAVSLASEHLIRLETTGVLPASPDVSLAPTRVSPWVGGTFVRFAQAIDGIPVEGHDVVVSLDPDGVVRHVEGAPLADGAVDTVPRLSAEDAIVAADRLVHGLFGPAALWPSRAEPRVWVTRAGEPRLAWAVDASTAAPMGTYRVLVDAETGDVLHLRPTHHDAKADIYPTNPDASDLVEVELPRLDGTGISGAHTYVQSCTNWTTGGFGGGTCRAKATQADPDENGDFFFEPNPTSADDPFAEVQMYYHLDKVAQYFEDHHGFRHARPIEALVNFPMDNAFYGDADGDGVEEVAFGQNATIDFAYDGDVVYHEFTHSVFATVATAGFFLADEIGVDYAPMALNEGSADLFSMVISGDPRLGEYAGKGFGLREIRDMEPDRTCPGSLYGESHEDGMIWGALGWNLIDDPRIGADVVSQLNFGVLEELGDEITWAKAGEALVRVADALRDAGAIDAATRAAIQEHVDASGIVGCERIIRLDDGAKPTLLGLYVGVADQVGYVPLTAQLSLDAPEGATELRFRVDDLRTSASGLGWSLFVRRGDHVVHEVQSVFGFDVPVPSVYDFQIDGEGDGTELVLDENSDPPLVPGATYYFALSTRNLGSIGGFDLVYGEFSVNGGVTVVAPEPGDTGNEGEDIARGCGCANGGGSAGWLGILALAAIVRRRARATV